MPLHEWVVLEAGTYIFMALTALLDTGSTSLNRLCMAGVRRELCSRPDHVQRPTCRSQRFSVPPRTLRRWA